MTGHPVYAAVTDVRDYYDRLRAAADISAAAHELLGDRITGESRSTIFVNCPRHASQSGRSFQISLHQGSWFCHGCGVGGGVIEFVEYVLTGAVTKCSRSGVTDTHRQARDWVAERVGLPKLSEAGLSPEKIAEQERLRAEGEQVFACLTAYADLCHAALLANTEAIAWLKEHYAINDESIAQFRIGWADDPGALDALVGQGFTAEIITATGLFTRDLSAPFFRKRVLFPFISDGRVTYLTGRRTPWSEDNEYEQAKYKKLPVYDEKKHPNVSKAVSNAVLFGEDILRTRPPQVVLAEGITDAIASMQAGFPTISPATVNIADRDFDRLVSKLRGVEGVLIAFDNELSAVGADSAIAIARRLDKVGIPAEIATVPLREKQEKARTEFAALLGDSFQDYMALPANKRAACIKETLEDRPEDVERANRLLADAKIDINEWFLTGGTTDAFAEFLAASKNYVRLQIDSLTAIENPDELSEALAPILRDVAAQGQVAQEAYIKAIKARTGLGVAPLRKRVGQLAKEAQQADRKAQRQHFSERAAKAQYRMRPHGLVLLKPVDGGEVEVPLTNFTAAIVAIVIRDNGIDTDMHLEIEARVHGVTVQVQVPSRSFGSMSWVIEHLGPNAVIYAGFSLKDHTRAAIQVLSCEKRERRVYTHTGFRKLGQHGHCFLHGGGAIGEAGAIAGVEVAVPESLSGVLLPNPPEGDERVRVVRASMGLLKLGPATTLFPLYCAIWRAVLGSLDSSLHFAGPTGVFKSEAVALAQQHYGAQLDARHLLGSWSSTENALEELAFTGKDIVVTVDDFAPSGSGHDVQRYHKKADRIFRAAGNKSGRARLTADGTPRSVHPPRGLVVSTGEDIPAGQSLRARLHIIEVKPGDIDATVLTRCQADAANGDYAAAMSAFVQWVAKRYEGLHARVRQRELELRGSQEDSSKHRRTPANAAQLQVGIEIFLEFATEVGAVTQEQAVQQREQCWNALMDLADAQAQHLLASEPTSLFLVLLRSAIAAGEAHVANLEGECPPASVAIAVGWERHGLDSWIYRGARVGWLDGEHLYLDLPAAFKAAQGLGTETERLAVSMRTLARRMEEKGLLVTRDEKRSKNTIRKTLAGTRRDVLHLRSDLLVKAGGTETDQPSSDKSAEQERGDVTGGSGWETVQ